jgi:IS30 family transposase
VRAAAREVGVSRSAGTNWTRGYKVFRNGVEVGFVPPLDRLEVREISTRYLSQDERIAIADLRQSGLSLRAIAERVGRAPSTISRELRRNLVERQTRVVRLMHLPRGDADTLHAALVARMRDLPPGLMRSITWDQGIEMARHLATAAKLGSPVYFCDSHSPWQRGTNENTNGLLRDYFPKGVTLINHSPEHLLAVENELNNRPRMVLQDRCPADLFAALLASNGPSVLRR